jgi:G3E family GTPase
MRLASMCNRLAGVMSCLRALAPLSTHHATSFCAVPLPYLFDVRYVDSGQGQAAVVSHEANLSVTPLAFSLDGGNIRGSRNGNAQTARPAATTASVGHLQQDQLTSFTFNASTPFALGAFHQFVSTLPSGIVRIKGFLQFQHDRSSKWYVHMCMLQALHVYIVVLVALWRPPPLLRYVFLNDGLPLWKKSGCDVCVCVHAPTR